LSGFFFRSICFGNCYCEGKGSQPNKEGDFIYTMINEPLYNYDRDYDPAVGRYIESDPIGLAGGGYSTYAYVGGNPLSKIDPFGLWSFSFGGYVGPGAEVTFGYDDRNGAFFTARVGFGLGVGATFNPKGGIPNSEATPGCGAGGVLSVSGKAGAGFGPFLNGDAELGVDRNYQINESDWYHDQSLRGLSSDYDEGFHLGASFGAQVTLYGGRH
jgi:RHS repeat-associated protein